MTASKRKYYAVKSGHTPGIYDTWDACKQQVAGFKGNQYKSFPTIEEAQQYLNSGAYTGTKVQAASVSVSVPEIQKPSRERHLSERSAFSVTSSLRDLRGTLPSEALTADLATTGVYRLEYDGASKGNPGDAGAGALLRHPDGSVVCEVAVGLGKTTNNVAEYRGLIAGLKKARDLGIQRIQAQGDSKLVTQQLRGVWAVKNENLAILCQEAQELVKGFKEFEIRHVDREWNSAADVLANKGVGLPEEKFVSVFGQPK